MSSRKGMMLALLKNRLCPLLAFTIIVGCGKQINDPSDVEISRAGQTEELPSSLAIQVNENESSFKNYLMPRNAWFTLPVKLLAKNASAAGKRVKIYYNLEANGNYEFHCYYQSYTLPSELTFEKCQSSDEVTIISSSDDLQKMEFPIDKGTSIKVELINPSANNLRIDAIFGVDWK
jgi:hypothetical protein